MVRTADPTFRIQIFPKLIGLTAPDECDDFDLIACLEGTLGVLGAGNQFAISFDCHEFGLQLQMRDQPRDVYRFGDGMRLAVDLDFHAESFA